MAKKIEWTKAATNSLIELYEGHPCLYDTKHKFYSNKHASNDALLKISAELQNVDPTIQVEDIKKKITSLRQQFSHGRSKVLVTHSGMESEDMYEPTVWWYEKLLFLTPHVTTRKTTSTLDALVEDNSELETWEGGNTGGADSNSMCRGALETPKTLSKKRKTDESAQDPIMNETVTTLKMLGTSLGTKRTPTAGWQVYSEYIVNELQEIGNEELVNDAKHEINNIISGVSKVAEEPLTVDSSV